MAIGNNVGARLEIPQSDDGGGTADGTVWGRAIHAVREDAKGGGGGPLWGLVGGLDGGETTSGKTSGSLVVVSGRGRCDTSPLRSTGQSQWSGTCS